MNKHLPSLQSISVVHSKLISLALWSVAMFSLAGGATATDNTAAAAGTVAAFSVMEQNYLREHPEISMCVDPDWLPYEKLDSNGQHIGLVARYMALFQERLGVLIKPVQVKSWDESQVLYRAGKCDIVSALNITPERAEYLDFTRPYIKSPAVLVLREDEREVSSLAQMEHRTLGMVKGYVYESRLREDYPNIRITYLTNMQQGLEKISRGELDATLGPLFLISASIQYLGLDNLKMVGNTSYQDELHVGVRKNDILLLDAFNKIIASLSGEDHANIRHAWSVGKK